MSGGIGLCRVQQVLMSLWVVFSVLQKEIGKTWKRCMLSLRPQRRTPDSTGPGRSQTIAFRLPDVTSENRYWNCRNRQRAGPAQDFQTSFWIQKPSKQNSSSPSGGESYSQSQRERARHSQKAKALHGLEPKT